MFRVLGAQKVAPLSPMPHKDLWIIVRQSLASTTAAVEMRRKRRKLRKLKMGDVVLVGIGDNIFVWSWRAPACLMGLLCYFSFERCGMVEYRSK